MEVEERFERKWEEWNKRWEEVQAEWNRKWEESQKIIKAILMRIEKIEKRHLYTIGALGAR
ncbi:MAG: hypothetical protein RMI01_04255 [Thermodesulfovibrio sp.]|nr:hypothetical protein [Thermodesulfovibrio sp.]